MSKRYKTTINLLRRTAEMIMAERRGESWWVNPNGHPLPMLPDRVYLEGGYLVQLAKSAPHLVTEASRLLKYIGEDKEGRIRLEGRRKNKER